MVFLVFEVVLCFVFLVIFFGDFSFWWGGVYVFVNLIDFYIIEENL